jgi:hypothetical protein
VVNDVRLAGPGLGELVKLLSDSNQLNDFASITACAERLQLSLGNLSQSDRPRTRWQSIVLAMDEECRLHELLADVLGTLSKRSATAAAIRSWMAQGARSVSIATAAEECRSRLKELRAEPDPRNSEPQLIVLSSLLVDLIEGLSRPDIAIKLFSFSSDPIRVAESAAADARRAASAVDRLLVGVRLAKSARGRVGASVDAANGFAAEFSILGQLLDARMAADEALTSVVAAFANTPPFGSAAAS